MHFDTFEPRPLIFQNQNIVVSWSPKSACSHVVVWFLLKEGLLPAANYYNGWPHLFRTEVYYRTHTHQRRWQDLRGSGGKGFTLIRVTRDPVKRFVACFRHAARYDFLHELVRRKVGTDPARDGLSLLDYHEALSGEVLTVPSPVDIHACAQAQPIWEAGFDRVITHNLDETPLNDGLNQIEAELGMGITRFEKFPKFKMLRQSHYARNVDFAGDGPVESFRFRPADTDAFPKKQLEALPLVRQMTEDLHAADMGRVGKGDTAGVLFQKAAEPA